MISIGVWHLSSPYTVVQHNLPSTSPLFFNGLEVDRNILQSWFGLVWKKSEAVKLFGVLCSQLVHYYSWRHWILSSLPYLTEAMEIHSNITEKGQMIVIQEDFRVYQMIQ